MLSTFSLMATWFFPGLKLAQCFQGPELKVCGCVFCAPSKVYSCSMDGTVLAWNVSTLQVTGRFQLSSSGLTSIRLHGDRLWCCKSGPCPQSGQPTSLLWEKDAEREQKASFLCFTPFQSLF